MTLYEKIAERLTDVMKLPYKRTLKELRVSFPTEAELAAFTAQIDADMQEIQPGFRFLDDSREK